MVNAVPKTPLLGDTRAIAFSLLYVYMTESTNDMLSIVKQSMPSSKALGACLVLAGILSTFQFLLSPQLHVDRDNVNVVNRGGDDDEDNDRRTAVPTYYVNLERSTDRRAYMEHMFEKYFDPEEYKVTRINAVDLSNMTDIGNILGLSPTVDTGQYLDSFCKNRGEVALTLSHFKAMASAYEDEVPFALIMEDDASFEFVPWWPVTIKQLVNELTAKDPAWDTIRLAYLSHHSFMTRLIQRWKASFPRLPALVRWYGSGPLDWAWWWLAGEAGSGAGPFYGCVATVYSRKALSKITSKHVVLHARPNDNPNDPFYRYGFRYSKKDVKYKDLCVIDQDLNHMGLKQYIAIPPYFTYRLAEKSLGTRTKGKPQRINDQVEKHLNSRAWSTRLFMEFLELQNSLPERLPRYELLVEAYNE